LKAKELRGFGERRRAPKGRHLIRKGLLNFLTLLIWGIRFLGLKGFGGRVSGN